MGVFKKMKRAMSFKNKSNKDKKVTEEPAAKDTQNGMPPKKSNSMVSLLRKYSTLRREKPSKFKADKDAPAAETPTPQPVENSLRLRTQSDVSKVSEKAVAAVVVAEAVKTEAIEVATPKQREEETVEEKKVEPVAEDTKIDAAPKEEIDMQPKGSPILDKVAESVALEKRMTEVFEEIDQMITSKNAEDQNEVSKEEEQSATEEKVEEEPAEISTEILSIHRDKTETAQNGGLAVRTIEKEQERQVTKDGTTISSSTKTTSTIVSPNGTTNGIIKTEVTKNFLPKIQQKGPVQVVKGKREMMQPSIVIACAMLVLAVLIGSLYASMSRPMISH